MKWGTDCWCFFVVFFCREGRSNAHIKGDYQRIGDVMLKNLQGLKVRHGPTTLCQTAIYVYLLDYTDTHRCPTSVHSPWQQTCTGSLTFCWNWRRRAGRLAGWRVSAGTLSCKRSATSPSTSSFCGPCIASFTTSRSWSACANTTHRPTWTSGTAEVQHLLSVNKGICRWSGTVE